MPRYADAMTDLILKSELYCVSVCLNLMGMAQEREKQIPPVRHPAVYKKESRAPSQRGPGVEISHSAGMMSAC